jgi:hypothetical protein
VDSLLRNDESDQPNKNLYPHCILWSPLPPITWILPFIGHTAIANSEGIIYDFAGPYTIGVEHMAFGNPTRYIQLDPAECSNMSWDEGVDEVRFHLSSSVPFLFHLIRLPRP